MVLRVELHGAEFEVTLDVGYYCGCEISYPETGHVATDGGVGEDQTRSEYHEGDSAEHVKGVLVVSGSIRG